MSEATKDDKPITLFFVKNLSHQFGPVEKFLKKRGYNVIVETEIRTALDRITTENPEYVFLAWDHKNENIRQMPKAIYQASTSTVVPFIMSTQRDQINQIERSGFENKLYPPLSGPAIIRAISKYEKKNQIFDQINSKKAANAKKESQLIQVKSFFKEDDAGPEVNIGKSKYMDKSDRSVIAGRSRGKLNMFVPQNRKKADRLHLIVQKGVKSKLMTAVEQEFGKINTLNSSQKEKAKAQVNAVLENQIDSDTTVEKLGLTIEEQIGKITEMSDADQKQTAGKLIALMQDEVNKGNSNLDISQGIDLPSSETMSELLSREIKSLSEGQIIFLDQSFTESIKPEMFDVIETYADKTSEQTDLSATTQIFVLVVQELEWTGYLTVASENYLDVASAQVILNNWIKQMIRIQQIDQPDNDQNGLDDATLFEVRVSKVDFADFCSYKSEFFKEVEYEGKKTMVGFFSFSPYQVINSIHESFDMLELSTEFLQPNKDLPFDVNLYLPENNRFILYLRPGSYLDDLQVLRLQTRNVKYIFSNVEYESAMLKYKAEFNIETLIKIYNRIKASNT